MTANRLGRVLGIYCVVLAVACVAMAKHFRLEAPLHDEIVASAWNHGKLVARAIFSNAEASSPELEQARASGATLVRERVVGQSPVIHRNSLLFAVSFVPGHDGLRARLGDKVVYLTPDDLLSYQLYDHGPSIDALVLTVGIDIIVVNEILAERLGQPANGLLDRLEIDRVRMERTPSTPLQPTAEKMSRNDVARSITAAGEYLARSVGDDGRFRYLVDATTGDSLPGYNWPRHAGATYFLAQAAAFTHDRAMAASCLRAAQYMKRDGLVTCGSASCIGDEAVVDLGSSALAALAFAEIVRTGLDEQFRPVLAGLARFMRGQQRADGEFMHEYQRYPQQPVDKQGLYYSSEAVLALGRIYRVLNDPADLDAATRGLAYLVGPGWSFFGDRYYFGEEHWTCQAMAALWRAAPSPKALDYCLRWSAFNRQLQQRDGEAPYDSDGALGVGPLVTPRLTPIASRCEAGVATLEIARSAGVDRREVEALEGQMRRALAFLLRHQMMPGPTHLFGNPEAVRGAFPGSAVDWKLRIDYVQHAGSALIRWLDVTAP